ncbi:MAG: HAD-IIB family hydrolase [Hyphomonadaceae bacterium]|nr:HAD-IIB family hydrolase [Hyphomonadaceae bacterium]
MKNNKFFERDFSTLLFDIDDTITTEGKLPAASYTALEYLQKAGCRLIAVTGRPAGWCDMIARFWPVDAVVGENGAFYFRYVEETLTMKNIYAAGLSVKKARAEHAEIEQKVLAKFPNARLSKDQAYRDIDVAIDFSEDIDPPLPMDEVIQIKEFMEDMGLTAKISSIHVNAWRGNHNKLSMVKQLVQDEFGMSNAELKKECLYVGDSPNDEPMFEYFDHSVGVHNVMDFWDQLKSKPGYVTVGYAGDGFVELSAILLKRLEK